MKNDEVEDFARERAGDERTTGVYEWYMRIVSEEPAKSIEQKIRFPLRSNKPVWGVDSDCALLDPISNSEVKPVSGEHSAEEVRC